MSRALPVVLAPRNDPNAISLRADTTRRLASLLGSGFETDEFSLKLESHIDQATAKALRQEQKIVKLSDERDYLNATIRTEKHKLLVISFIACLSFLFNIILLIKS